MAMVSTVFGPIVVVARVWTGTETAVAPAWRVTECGGVTTFWLPAVPLDWRLTVIALDDACEALTTNVAAIPSETWLATD